jgi:geranylgeranylglycerol-phosphate geranylgeranyltransferase
VSVLRNLEDLISLTRPHNGLIAAASVLIGSFLAAGTVTPGSVTASAMAFFVCSGAYVVNDLYDLETDRINKPSRPIAAGRVGKDGARKSVLVLWALGGGFALLSGMEACVFFTGWMALLWLYSWRIKAHGWIGHILVSAVASSGFMLGAMLSGGPEAGVIPLVIAFLFHLAREVAKGIADLRGDRASGLATVAVRVGGRRALMVLLGLISAVGAASLVPFAAGLYGSLYFLPVALVIYPALAVCLGVAVRARWCGRDAGRAAALVAKMFKATMPVGLLAFFLAGV